MNQTCKYCKSAISEAFYFCPNCGKKLKEPPFKFSVSKSIGVIVFSLLFPPFGIVPGLRYLLKNDIRAKIVGVLVITTTIVLTIVLINWAIGYINKTMNTYNEILNLQGGN